MNFFNKIWNVISHLGFYMLLSWLMPKPPKGNDAPAMQDPPTSKVGDPIQVFFGPFEVSNMNSVGVGDKSVQAIKQKGGKKG